VRSGASSALRQIHTKEAYEALSDSLNQEDARVRQQVVRDVGSFYKPETIGLIKRILKSEKNPAILESAIRNLGRYHHKSTRRLLLKYLKSRSYRNALASAAIEAIRMLDEPLFTAPLQRTLSEQESEFRSWSFAQGLDTLAYISRNEEDKTTVRKFLADYVNHPKERFQTGAIQALGTLGDPRAIAIVETFDGDDPRDRIQRSAKNALKALREKKELVPAEIIHLRQTVDKIIKENENLRNDLEDIKKRLDAKDKSAETEKDE
jgi:aminopeptidase N